MLQQIDVDKTANQTNMEVNNRFNSGHVFLLGKIQLTIVATKLVPLWLLVALLPSKAQPATSHVPTEKNHQRCFPKSRKLRYAYGFGAFAIVAAAVVWQHLFNL